MVIRSIVIFGLILGVVAPTQVSAQGRPSGFERLKLPTLPELPRVDGVLGTSEWDGATAVRLDFETQPAVNGPARVATECWMARGDDRLFVGCRAEDPSPGDIRAQYVDRDEGTDDDGIVLYLDPFDDGQRAYVFRVSAVGVQTDGIFDQARGDLDNSWNTVWASAGRITAAGYDVEFSVPFSSLRFPPTGDSPGLWRFYFERSRPRTEQTTTRSTAYDPDDPCRLCYAHHLTPGEVVGSTIPIEAIPTFTTVRTNARDGRDAPYSTEGWDPDVGLDVRLNLSSQAVVNATINPDFSHIEADALQLVGNTRFALSVPERRPFFLESAEIFQSPLRAVFTRSVVDPVVGAKLSGRSGPWSGGMLYARDAATNLLLPGSFGSTFTSLDRASDAWALRGTRALGSGRNVVGALATHRSSSDYDNSVGGLDTFLRPMRAVQLRGQFLASTTTYPEGVQNNAGLDPRGGAIRDYAAQVDARYDTRDWSVQSRTETIGPDFRADLGFMPQVDSRRLEGSVTRRYWGDDLNWMTRVYASLGTWHLSTRSGELKERGIWSQAVFEGPLQSSFAVNPFWMTERFAGREFARSGVNMTASIAPSDGFALEIRTRDTSVIDYANVRPAWERVLRADAALRLGRRVSLDLSANSRAMRHEGALVNAEQIVRVQSLIGLSSRTFVSLLAQGRRVEVGLPDGTEARLAASVETQAFLTYRRDGQTAFFLGYSDFLSEGGVLSAGGLQRQSLTWFLKVSYAWSA